MKLGKDCIANNLSALLIFLFHQESSQKLKIAEILPVFKKGKNKNAQITDQFGYSQILML